MRLHCPACEVRVSQTDPLSARLLGTWKELETATEVQAAELSVRQRKGHIGLMGA